jgi:4-hydroxy-tetrahydrodipicolinate reductase
MKIAIIGASGRIGKLLTQYIIDNTEHELVAGIVSANSNYLGQEIKHSTVKYSDNFEEFIEDIDVTIDFSNKSSMIEHAQLCAKHQIAFVSGTTGFNDKEMEEFIKLSTQIPILIASNFSIGISLIKKLSKISQKILPQANIEIIETHHRYKLDAPSGTALDLAKNLSNNIVTSERFGDNNQRTTQEIGISSVRGGNIFGEHQLRFILDEEEIKLEHQVYDRIIFASGALKCAEWLISQPTGFYEMDDYIDFNI